MAVLDNIGGGVSDHGSLTGLSDDDHTQYALLLGRSGGQTLLGGIGSGDDLTIQSTSHAIKGDIVFGSTSGMVYNEVTGQLELGGGITDSADATINMLRTISGTGNGHGIADETEFSSSGSYSAYDALITVSSSGSDHVNAFQSRSSYDSSGTITNFRDALFSNIVKAGTVTNLYHLDIAPRKTGGTVINQYGLNIDDIDFGTTLNYAIKTNAGLVELGDEVRIIKNDANTIVRIVTTGTGQYSILNFASTANGSDGQVRYDQTIDRLEMRAASGVVSLALDGDTTAGSTKLLVYDIDNATLERVSVGAANSGGSGFKVLRIPN